MQTPSDQSEATANECQSDELDCSTEALRQKLLFLEAQVNASIDGILVVDTNKHKLLQNNRLNELLSVPPHISSDNQDRAMLRYFLSIVKHPEVVGNAIEFLYANQHLTDRCEVELKDGRVLD